jgi:transcriptional regulator of aromatic amino acid metabolism
MNNKFWREIFDQITSLVMVFRIQNGTGELMFVNKAVHSCLGYSPEAFVMESEQTGELRSSLDNLFAAAADGIKSVELADLTGQNVLFAVESSSFSSDAIKEDLAILTLHPMVNSVQSGSDQNTVVAESIVMKSVLDRISQLEEVGANVAFVGGIGNGKRFFMDRLQRGALSSGYSIWKLDYADGKKPAYSADGVQVDLDMLMTSRLRKDTTILLYEMQGMSNADQVRLFKFIDGQGAALRFICGSTVSPDALVATGKLMPELYYKLNLISVVLPSLDMRRADIRPYTWSWLRRVSEALAHEYPDISDKEWTRLFHHEYKESYDELNVILKRSLLRWKGDKFQFDLEQADSAKTKLRTTSPASTDSSSIVLDYRATHDEHMHAYLNQVMDKYGWKIYGNDGAAAHLGIKPTTLQSKIEKYGVRKSAGH